MNRQLAPTSMLIAVLAAVFVCGTSAAFDELEETLDILMRETPFMSTLTGDKPITTQLPPPFIDYEHAARVLDAAKRDGRIQNPDLGWFVSKIDDTPKQWLDVPGRGRVPVNNAQLVFYSRSAIQKLLQDPDKMRLLAETGMHSGDSPTSAVEKIKTFLDRIYYAPPGQKSQGFTPARTKAFGVLLGFPTSEVRAYNMDSRGKGAAIFETTVDGTKFRGAMFSRRAEGPTPEENFMRANWETAAHEYVAARKAGKSPSAIVSSFSPSRYQPIPRRHLATTMSEISAACLTGIRLLSGF